MLRNRLFVSGLFLLALCGCIAPIKYAGSEYRYTNKDDMDRLDRDMDTRILNSVAPIDKPFDARALYVFPSRALLEDAIQKSFMISLIQRGISSTDFDEDRQFLSRVVDGHENRLRRNLEALRRRNLFKEVDTTTNDNPETVHMPGYGVYICWSIETWGSAWPGLISFGDIYIPIETWGYSPPALIRFGEGQKKSLLSEGSSESEATQDMPGIRKRRVFSYATSSPSLVSYFDELENFQKEILHDWLNQVERTAARHFKR